jgi:hypothetical protein
MNAVARFVVERHYAGGSRREIHVTSGPACLGGVVLHDASEIVFRGARWTVTLIPDDATDRWVLRPARP